MTQLENDEENADNQQFQQSSNYMPNFDDDKHFSFFNNNKKTFPQFRRK